jgi:1,4-alpha-glucan branching enzyme
VHLGSWRQENGKFYNYRRLAEEIAPYALSLGATHVEILPITEHPLDGSWGYQPTGYFAPTSRYGTPEDFKYFVNTLHLHGLDVILDWVPAHFPKDAHGLRQFDGAPLFEYGNEAYAEHKDWGTLRFDLGNVQVRDFLIASALFWLKEYHVDGLRVDAVSSMLYLDFGRDRFSPNIRGGREDLEAVEFLRLLNREVRRKHPAALMIAEEATAFPKVTGDPSESLGFHYKWNMGWMHDSLSYVQTPAPDRRYYHQKLTFPLVYAFDEQFVLPLSHDECVHGKKSFLDKMPGAYDEKFALLRAYYAYMFTQPGKKLLFMGGEFAQFIEWRFSHSLDWFLEEYESHRKMLAFVKTLGALYNAEPALWDDGAGWAGFSWVKVDDADRNVIAYTRTSRETGDSLLVVVNFSPSYYQNYRLSIMKPTACKLLLNSDRKEFFGNGQYVPEQVRTSPASYGDKPYSLDMALPPLSALIYRLEALPEENEIPPEVLSFLAI